MSKVRLPLLMILGVVGLSFGLDYQTSETYSSSGMCASWSWTRNATELLTLANSNEPYGTHEITLYETVDSIRRNHNPYFNFGTYRDDLAKKMAYLNGHLTCRIDVRTTMYNYQTLIASAYIIQAHPISSTTVITSAFDNLVIMADGLDPNQRRSIVELTTNDKYKNLFATTPYIDANGQSHLSPLAAGYDICFIDFANGSADLRTNARAMLYLVDYIRKNFSGVYKLSVGGFSMGGVVSRLAMMYGQKPVAGKVPVDLSTVKKFISIDAPQWGAEVPIYLQHIARDEENNMPAGMARLRVPASQQLLYENITDPGRTVEHAKFFNWLLTLNPAAYMPKNMVMYSLAVSNFAEPYSSYPSSGTYKVFTMQTLPRDLKGMEPHIVYLNGENLEPGSYVDYLAPLIPKGTRQFMGMDINVTWSIPEKPINSPDAYFKPTHIPVRSAFCLNPATPSSLMNDGSLKTLTEQDWSPFHKIVCTKKRYEHIDFSWEVMDSLVMMLKDKTLYNKYAKRTYPGGIFKRQAGEPGLAGAVERTEFTVNTTGSNMIVSVPTALAGSPIAWSLFDLSGRQVLSSNGSIKAGDRFIIDGDSKIAGNGKYILKISSKKGIKSFPVYQM